MQRHVFCGLPSWPHGHGFIAATSWNDAGNERLAQGLERGARKFGQLVEEEHAVMGERGLARSRRRAAADERGRRRRVMRRAQDALAPPSRREGAGDALDRRRLERFLVGERRQQADQALRKHRLAGAWRTDHEQAQLTGSRDLEGALGSGLAAHVAQIGHGRRGCGDHGPGHVQAARVGGVAGQERAHDVGEMAGAAHFEAADECRFVGARLWQDKGARDFVRHPPEGERHRERALHGSQLACQRELAGELEALEPREVELAGGGQDAERDRQVEAPRLLRQVGRREADGDALVVRELEAAGLQRRAHPFARFLDLGVGQADEREARQAVGQMHLDRHRG